MDLFKPFTQLSLAQSGGYKTTCCLDESQKAFMYEIC